MICLLDLALIILEAPSGTSRKDKFSDSFTTCQQDWLQNLENKVSKKEFDRTKPFHAREEKGEKKTIIIKHVRF